MVRKNATAQQQVINLYAEGRSKEGAREALQLAGFQTSRISQLLRVWPPLGAAAPAAPPAPAEAAPAPAAAAEPAPAPAVDAEAAPGPRRRPAAGKAAAWKKEQERQNRKELEQALAESQNQKDLDQALADSKNEAELQEATRLSLERAALFGSDTDDEDCSHLFPAAVVDDPEVELRDGMPVCRRRHSSKTRCIYHAFADPAAPETPKDSSDEFEVSDGEQSSEDPAEREQRLREDAFWEAAVQGALEEMELAGSEDELPDEDVDLMDDADVTDELAVVEDDFGEAVRMQAGEEEVASEADSRDSEQRAGDEAEAAAAAGLESDDEEVARHPVLIISLM